MSSVRSPPPLSTTQCCPVCPGALGALSTSDTKGVPMPNNDRTFLPPLDTAPEDWEALLRTQAVLLDTILTQLETAFHTLHQSRGKQARPRQAPQRLAMLLAQTQGFLQAQAHTPVTRERQVAPLHACPAAVLPHAAAVRITQMAQAITTLHAQLTTARHRIARLTAIAQGVW